MLKNWAMRSANAAAIRSAGDAEYARKRAEKERSEKKAAERRRARVQAARTATLIVGSEQQTILRHAHQYGRPECSRRFLSSGECAFHWPCSLKW